MNAIPSVCTFISSKEIGEKLRIQLRLMLPRVPTRLEETKHGLMIIADPSSQEEQDLISRLLVGSK